MNKKTSALAGVGIGAVATYFLDPERGRSRRASARARLTHLGRVAPHQMGVAARDLAHRSHGVLSKTRSGIFGRFRDTSDGVVQERVRSALGRVVSHPHSIEVLSNDGCVTLNGPILSSEVKPLLERVSRVWGVKDVVNRLEAHKPDEKVPGLQGGSTPPRS